MNEEMKIKYLMRSSKIPMDFSVSKAVFPFEKSEMSMLSNSLKKSLLKSMDKKHQLSQPSKYLTDQLPNKNQLSFTSDVDDGSGNIYKKAKKEFKESLININTK